MPRRDFVAGCLVLAAVMGATCAAAPQTAEPVALNATGEKLLASYSAMLEQLQAQIIRFLPRIAEPQMAALVKAYQDEAAAMAAELKAMHAQARSKDKEAAAKAYRAAQQARELAAKNAQAPVKSLLPTLQRFLASDKLDALLVRYVILAEATPRGLAQFAQQGREQQALVERLLADGDLMKQMLIAGGAKDGQYGQAMRIYNDIQQASSKANAGALQRLALAVSLEHAVPMAQSNPLAAANAPAAVDPVKRYLHFEKAFLDGELDPCFADLTVWEYRMVVNGDEPDEILSWGREMLRNYRPDHIYTPDYRWRYVGIVNSDVKYGSQDVKNDLPTLQKYQNIILNGGVCGRRAFFGRFILRCFGIPTLARPQTGHAALTHWTPDGWVINLGAGWGWGRTSYGADLDFLAHTQAREDEEIFLQVLRAQWIGTALGEKKAFGFYAPTSGFWNAVALYRQREIIAAAEASPSPRQSTGGRNGRQPTLLDRILATDLTAAAERIAVAPNGVITIPAAACSKPTSNTRKILFMKSFLGGRQLHYGRLGNPEVFAYTFAAPAAGRYALSARVVTVNMNQHLSLTVNNAQSAVDIPVPYTIGLWGKTEPVEITLREGTNTLSFTLPTANYGVTIKDFTLTPVK